MSLVAWYPLNGNANDYSGRGLHGTAYNISWVAGKTGQCGSFTGAINSYISIPVDSMRNLGDFSVSFWVNSSNLSKSINTVFHATRTGGNDFSIEMYSNRFVVLSWGKTFPTTNTINTWYHITSVRRGNLLSLYKNGVSLGTQTINSNMLDIIGAIILGQEQDAVGGGFDPNQSLEGLLCDVRIYDHALSENEIQEIAKAKILHYTFSSFKEPTVNLIPNSPKNSYPTVGNTHRTFNTNQYNNNQYFSIGTVSSVSNNIVTLSTVDRPIYTYDVLNPQTTGGGVTAGTHYFIKKHSSNSFSLHAYNNSQDGSQGYAVHNSVNNDVRISINATNFPTMWKGNAHLPNSALVKEIIPNGFNYEGRIHDCIRCHGEHKPEGEQDYIAYGVNPVVESGKTYTFSCMVRAATPASIGKNINMSAYTSGGWSFTGSRVTFTDMNWKRLVKTGVAPNSGGTSLYFPFSKGGTVDISEIQVEEKGYASPFTEGTREAKLIDASGFGNDATLQLANTPKWVEDSPVGRGSYYFNGSKLITTNKLFYDNVNQEWTVAGWVKLDENTGTQFFDNFNRGNRVIQSDHKKALLYVNDGAGNYCYAYSSAIIPINEWLHFSFVYRSSNDYLKIYMNGADITGHLNVQSGYTPQGFASITKFGEMLKGYMTDIRVYGTALSAADIQELYKIRAEIDNEGNLLAHNMNETGHNSLIYDYTLWQNGQTGSMPGFSALLARATATRVISDDPWGKSTVVWQGETTSEASPSTRGESDIYCTYKPIDNTKLYRFSWWERRATNSTATSASYYAGLHGAPDGIKSLNSDTLRTNPYFWSQGQAGIPVNEWFLVVGHVYPHTEPLGSVAVKHPNSGVWRVDGSKIGNIYEDFRWHSTNTQARSRNLQIYSATAPGVIHQTAYPRMEICDGTEPSLAELLAGFDSNYIDKIRTEGGANDFKVEISKTENYAREIHETGPVNGLVAWYPLDYDTLDYSGGNKHATPTGVTAVEGLNGGCYSFDGNGYIRVPSITTPATTTTNAWGYWDGTTTVMLFSYSSCGDGVDLFFTSVAIAWNSQGDGSANAFKKNGVNTPHPSINEWHMFSVVNDQATNNCDLYIDGIYAGTAAFRTTAQTNNVFAIGSYNGFTYRWKGKIQDVRIYNRALTPEEISILYNLRKNKYTQFSDKGDIYLAKTFDETY